MKPLLLIAILLGAPATAASAQVDPMAQRRTAVVDVFEQCKDAVVNISSTHLVKVESGHGLFEELFQMPRRQRYRKYSSVGSGFVFHKDGYIATNAHVVARTAEIRVIFSDETEYGARVIAMDEKSDLAVIKIEPNRELKTLKLGSSSDLMVGETVIAIGNPLNYRHTVTAGVVSALDREIPIDRETSMTGLIQTDASINPGNSGGPLLNVLGNVIGVNTAIRGDAQNIGFAIPVDQLRQALPELLDVERRYRIVTGMSVTPDKRCMVVRVDGESPAFKARIEVGDRIEAIDGDDLGSGIDYAIAMLGRKAGDRIRIRYRRGGRSQDTVMTLDERPRPQGGQILRDRFGMQVVQLTPERARKVGLSAGLRGLMVTEITPRSAAARARFRKGDIITSLGRYQVDDVDEAGELLEKVEPGQIVAFGVLRAARGMIIRQNVRLKAE